MEITIKQMCPACNGLGKEVKYGWLAPYSTKNECPVCKGQKMITTFENVNIPDMKVN